MKRADILTSIVLVALALAGIFWVVPTETVVGEPGEIAPADMPKIALWVIAGCAGWQLVSALWIRNAKANPFDRFAMLFLAASTSVLFAALLGIWWLGYIAGGVLCIIGVGAIMRPKGGAWAWLVAVALALPVGIYALSWHGLRLSLP
ncbi:MAG: hypothetical protein ACR2PG_03380 [Hyphomicrobiaceae bacterium]